MFRFCISVLALALGFMSVTGCASSYCSEPEHEADAMCQLNLGGTVAAFTVSPSRVAINKDSSTEITISAYQKLTNKTAILTQSGGTAKSIPLGTVRSDGTLKVVLTASDLITQGFTPGLANVEITNQKQRIRIYIAPTFSSSSFSATHSVVADQGSGNMAAPSWVGVPANGSKKILTLNDFTIATIAKQAIGEYIYDAGNKDITKFSPLLFAAYNSTPPMDNLQHTIALSRSDLVIAEFGNASVSLLTQCALDGVCSSTAAPFTSIASFAASLDGNLYAGIFNAQMLVFSDAGLTSNLPIGNTPASVATPALVSVYDANDDTQPDVAIFHRDGQVSVAVTDPTGKSLTYDARAEAAFTTGTIWGNGPPDAVAAGDLDHDGLDDLVIAKAGALYLLLSDGAGGFLVSSALAIPMQGPSGAAMLTPVSAIAIGDVSPDDSGIRDLVLCSKQNRLLAVLENTATIR